MTRVIVAIVAGLLVFGVLGFGLVACRLGGGAE